MTTLTKWIQSTSWLRLGTALALIWGIIMFLVLLLTGDLKWLVGLPVWSLGWPWNGLVMGLVLLTIMYGLPIMIFGGGIREFAIFLVWVCVLIVLIQIPIVGNIVSYIMWLWSQI